MRWAEGFIAADWGTTNRRAYLVDGTGKRVDEFEDDKGILGVPKGGFGEAVAEIRQRLGDRPLLLAGMVGSNRGWIEAPYVPCVSFVDPDEADVMRGEEVQLLGAFVAGLVPADSLVCHPGTHNKWARLDDGRVTRFRTVMTGE